MSTHFDIACLDCEICDHEHHWGHRDEDALLEILDKREMLIPLFGAFKVQTTELRLEVSGSVVNLEFLHSHREHTLAVVCEYESYEACRQRCATGKKWRDR